MTTSRAQENQLVVMEESCTPLTAASSGILVDDKSNVPPRASLECHICMGSPTDPVATSCGHVFCWPCLSQWFEIVDSGPLKPCPTCRKLLSTDVNILSLHHGAGDAAARSGSSSYGDDSASEAAAAGNVVPPRPGNPLFFVPREPGSNPQRENTDSIGISRALHELARERSQGRSLVLERARQKQQLKQQLKQREKDLLRIYSDLTQETNGMGLHLAQLERRLAIANLHLPAGWSDDI